jgi:hypothetical protein
MKLFILLFTLFSPLALAGDGTISNFDLVDVAGSTFKCRYSVGTGSVQDCTQTQATTLINAFTGDSGSGGLKGAVPAPSPGDTGLGKFLHASGGWSVPAAASGVTYTSIATTIAAGSGRVTGSNPTTTSQYRSWLRNGNAATYTETDGTPTATPSAANGIRIYAGNKAWANSDNNNEPGRYTFYIGLNKNYYIRWYLSTGRTGFIDATPMETGASTYGYYTQYDPSTGLLNVVSNVTPLAGTHYIGNLETGIADNTTTAVYFDIFVQN